MLGTIYSFAMLLAEVGHGESGFLKFYNDYLNVPGFEAWKFLNLGVFIAIMAYLLKKPLSEAFKAKREQIRAELIRAEQEKQAALARLTSAETKLVELNSEKQQILSAALAEAEADAARLAAQTEVEAERLRTQTGGEIGRLTQQAQAELRRFSAAESIRLAEEKLRKQIDAEKDSRLVKASIEAIGGMN